jgi:2-keto-3-deoxy-L-rhamnonate aldolase RhmA
MPIYPNHSKRRLAFGELALGIVLRQSRTVDIAAISRTCGFDWMSIDMEHGSLGLDTAAQIANAALAVGITPIVRVPGKEHYHASRLLDAGAQGAIVPHIDSAEEARAAVDACKYPPVGRRSLASTQPLLAFESVPSEEAMRLVNEETILIAMLESPDAIAQVDEIAAVPGIDVLLIGTGDLAAEMGIPGKLTHPRIEDAYRRMIDACLKHKIHAGMAGIHDAEFAARLVDYGVRFITAGTDLNFLMAGARQRTGLLRGLLKPTA